MDRDDFRRPCVEPLLAKGPVAPPVQGTPGRVRLPPPEVVHHLLVGRGDDHAGVEVGDRPAGEGEGRTGESGRHRDHFLDLPVEVSPPTGDKDGDLVALGVGVQPAEVFQHRPGSGHHAAVEAFVERLLEAFLGEPGEPAAVEPQDDPRPVRQVPLPPGRAGVVAEVVLADVLVGGGEPLPVERRLPGPLQPDQHDQFHDPSAKQHVPDTRRTSRVRLPGGPRLHADRILSVIDGVIPNARCADG